MDSVFLGAIGFGLAVAFILVGMIGIVVPILPGMLLVWFTVLVYAWRTGFEIIGWPSLVLITLLALITGLSNIWLPLLGAQKTGAAKRALFLGVVGAIIGTFVIPLPILGTVIGYALGVFLGEFMKQRDWRLALKASLGGVAGWGISTVVEIVGALVILLIFVVQVLSG
ncbi:MAG: DUF456 domain-containing protein [Anaerolineaceae bacterium]|nr:DUF456 family protein [Chloroflexota bacterium]UCC54652.1 MAG: DUF456 domain-containing protein [Anaerolineaceae bacterium]